MALVGERVVEEAHDLAGLDASGPRGRHAHLRLQTLAGAGQLGQHVAVLHHRAGRIDGQAQDGAGAGRGERQLGAARLVELIAQRGHADARFGGVFDEPAIHLALLGRPRRDVLTERRQRRLNLARLRLHGGHAQLPVDLPRLVLGAELAQLEA